MVQSKYFLQQMKDGLVYLTFFYLEKNNKIDDADEFEMQTTAILLL